MAIWLHERIEEETQVVDSNWIDYWLLKIDSQAEFRFFEKGCRMGRAVSEDERPTSNIQRPTSNEKAEQGDNP
jgi:hypothetical protein